MTSDEVSHVGRAALWVGFIGMFFPTLYFAAEAFRAKASRRSYFYETLTAAITGIASVAYLTMATQQGYAGGEGEGHRQFFYARYIDWTLTTPLMLIDIACLAGASFDQQFLLVIADILMIVAGLIGANMNEGAKHEEYKWAFFALGMMFYMPIVHFLIFDLSGARGKSASLARSVGCWTLVLWSAYPLVWMIAEGTGTISCDTEAIVYTILDILAKSVFGFMIVSARDAIEEANARSSGDAPLMLPGDERDDE